MEVEGLAIDLQTILTLRQDFQDLSVNLRRRLVETDESINQVAQTWRDNNFLKFYETFKQDKDRLEPLFQRVDVFDSEFLALVEYNLRDYIGTNDTY